MSRKNGQGHDHYPPNEPVYADDRFFATLDPTTRRIRSPGGRWVLYTDTVGFIRKLPTQLVAAFRATLEEVRNASILIHVINPSHSDWKDHEKTILSVLRELKADTIPLIRVFTHADRLTRESRTALTKNADYLVSSLTGEGMDILKEGIENLLDQNLLDVNMLINHQQHHLMPLIYRAGRVLSQEVVEQGTRLRVRIDEANWGKIKKQMDATPKEKL